MTNYQKQNSKRVILTPES